MKSVTLLSTILLLTAVACGGEDAPPIDPCAPSVDPVAAFVFPVTVYTGSNGRDPYATALSANFNAATWAVADPSIATVVPIDDACEANILQPKAYVEILAPGTTTITATDGSGNTYESTLIATAYSTEDYDIGEQVYMVGSAVGTDPTCASCHLAAGGHDHTPTTTAYTPDEVLAQVITTGSYPNCLSGRDGTECNCDPNDPVCYELSPEQRDLNAAVPHAWELTPEELTGVIVYLRGLRPSGF